MRSACRGRPGSRGPLRCGALPGDPLINAMRAAYAGHYGGSIMIEGIAEADGLAALCLWIADRTFMRENA
jgi:hypothetical protein